MSAPTPPDKDDKTQTPAEKTAAQKAYDDWQAAKADEEAGPQKAQFMKWMDEWAEKQRKSAPRPRTPQGAERPKSFMERLFSDIGDSA